VYATKMLKPKFQFLLGRLETSITVSINRLYFMFQFLLGRLETISPKILPHIYYRFQFLLGRLETIMIEYQFYAN